MDIFPQLAGTVHSFFGKELEARKLAERIHAGERVGRRDGDHRRLLNPAACYPLYPTLHAARCPNGGRVVTMLNWVFRHEPSHEPTRMQAFRVREYVRVRAAGRRCVEWRDTWLAARPGSCSKALGLPAKADVATDPFFGKGGKMLAASQREHKLKFEVLVPVISQRQPDRVLLVQLPPGPLQPRRSPSALPDGDVAHTACLGLRARARA